MNERAMLCLPDVSIGEHRFRLPLCDATAMLLAGALLEHDLAKRANQLAAALVADPAFAIWAVLKTLPIDTHSTNVETSTLPLLGERAGVRGTKAEKNFQQLSISALSAHLSAQLLALLFAKSDNHFHPVVLPAEAHGRCAALVAESVSSAQEALRLHGSGEALAEPIYLAALTSRWGEWMSLASGGEPMLALPQNFWPLTMPDATTSSEAAVASRTAADEAWRRWLTEIPGVQNLLPGLVASLARLQELETNFNQSLHTAKLDSLKEFAYGAGHELNNPLANIASRAQTLLKDETDPERRRRLAAINTQAFRAHEMLADMMLFARPPQLVRKPIDLVQLIGEVLAELADDAATQQTTLHGPTRTSPISISADPIQLRVALRALCQNSLEALSRGGHVSVEICLTDTEYSATNLPLPRGEGRVGKDSPWRGEGEALPSAQHPHPALSQGERIPSIAPPSSAHVQIVVADNGPGIPPENRQKIFDPFFSGRESGRGLGFGLSKCWRIVTLHGGGIEVKESGGHETVFVISLPIEPAVA
jgi:hypothetical protein